MPTTSKISRRFLLMSCNIAGFRLWKEWYKKAQNSLWCSPQICITQKSSIGGVFQFLLCHILTSLHWSLVLTFFFSLFLCLSSLHWMNFWGSFAFLVFLSLSHFDALSRLLSCLDALAPFCAWWIFSFFLWTLF